MERQEFRQFGGLRQSCFEELKLDVAERLKEVTFSRRHSFPDECGIKSNPNRVDLDIFFLQV